MSGFGPTLPLPPPTRDGGYRGISCRLHPSISNAIASRGDCGQSNPSLASALGAISDSSAHFIAAATGATDRNLPSRHFPCRAYGDPYLFVYRDVRGFRKGDTIVTDTTAAEAPAESVPPEAAAAPAPEADLETEVNKSARERVIDHLTDSEGPQSVEQILAGTALNRNACEQAIFRAKKAEQIIWVAPGVYALAPPKPLPSSRNGHSNEEWIARIKAWQANPASWKIEEDGPPPNNPNHRIPQDVVGQFKDRQKRERGKAAQQEAEGAPARQAAADPH